ncbi:MAG: MFS transporter [Chloroflexi bacterium]|nr:MFS transporter [Chloroflexota bacterium]MDA1241127.1 MFS transporter [Chloroflexota bacterium]
MGARIQGIRQRLFFGWWLVGAAALIQMLIGVLMQQSFGAYAAAMTREFGWSRSALGFGYSLSRVETGLLGPIEGWLIDRFGARTIMRLGLVLFGVSLILFSQTRSLWMFYVSFALVSLGATLGGFMPITVALVKWFERYRGRAMGISSIGFAVGGLLAPAVVLSIEEFGWRQTAFASGVLVMVLGIPLTGLFKDRPEDIGEYVDGINPEEKAAFRESHPEHAATFTDVDFTAIEAFRTRAFWMIAFGHGAALTVVTAVMAHAYLHLTESLGYSAGGAAAVLALMTAMQMAGQVGGGILGDRMSKRMIAMGCMSMHAVGLLLLAYFGGVMIAAVGFAVLHGFAWGARGPLMQAIRADYFGTSSFGSITGTSQVITMFGTASGPIIAGILYDRTGSYEIGFTVIAAIAAAGSVFWILATKPAAPVRPPITNL